MEHSKGSNVSSPVYRTAICIGSESRGIAYCVNAKTGEMVYEQRLEPRPEGFYASPVVADGKIYLVNRTTGTYVLAAQPEFKQTRPQPAAGRQHFQRQPGRGGRQAADPLRQISLLPGSVTDRAGRCR